MKSEKWGPIVRKRIHCISAIGMPSKNISPNAPFNTPPLPSHETTKKQTKRTQATVYSKEEIKNNAFILPVSEMIAG